MGIHMKNLSRRDFLKGSVAGAAALTLAGLGLTEKTVAHADGIYTPGAYSATATGINTVLVTMTFSEDAITDVVLDVSGETATVGQAAAEELKANLMAAQSAEFDGVAGATMTSNAVMEAAAKCIAQAKGEIPVEVIGTAEEETGPTDWLGVAPEVAEADIAETLETDFLIVGAGNGGLASAAYAASKGYNTLVIEKGEDEDFGKLPLHLSKIEKAPFYGFWMGACLLTTEQGILIDENARAIDENREPIPGLFVTGDCSGGFFVNNYPCLMAGIAMGRTMTFGIKAVKVAFGEE